MSEPTPREQRDVDTGKVALAGVGLLLGLVVVLVAMAGLLHLFSPTGSVSGTSQTPASFAEPQLQVNPAQERQVLQATQAARLHSYGWVAPEEGVAHIPIERAMALIVEEGLPTPVPTLTPTVTPTATPSAGN